MRSLLDAEVRRLLESIEAEGAPALETLAPGEARLAACDALKDLAGAPEQVRRVENIVIPGEGGPLWVRVYTPEGDGPRPALLYFHGGGWVVCDLDTHDNVCRAIARRSGAVVIAVDYRLSPEHKFPAAVEDAWTATNWVFENAEAFGIDATRVAAGGDSAGGNLATVMALKSCEESGPRLALQALIYPVTNLASFDTRSYSDFAVGFHLSRAEMEWFRNHYLRRPEDAAHPCASPLLAPSLAGLPPALIITAECDVLRDEGEAYAKRLREAGVHVVHTRYPGMIHPFFSMPGLLPQAREAIGQVADALRSMTPV